MRLFDFSEDESTWSAFTVVDAPSQTVINYPTRPGKAATLVEVFVVVLSEYEQFMELIQVWGLN